MTLRNSGRKPRWGGSTTATPTYGKLKSQYVGVRLLCGAMLGVVLLAAGCSALPGPLKRLPGPFSRKSADESLRKQAEADSFPTAKQAGL